MRHGIITLAAAAIVAASPALMMAAPAAAAGKSADKGEGHGVQLGPRPFYLVDKMTPGDLKSALQQCANGPFFKTDFSIGHRGAALQFPEHTAESYKAAARMGAGIVECDVTITKDKKLVCRHAQCDLHTTTDIVARPALAAKCASPPDFSSATPFQNVKCCASDLNLKQFKSLCGKMDASGGRSAGTVDEYLGGTANWRTDLYATCGTVLSHKESIDLIKSLGSKFTPELKAADAVEGLPGGLTQERYAQKMIDAYKDAGIDPKDVFAQSFNLADVQYWIANEPAFGKQAVFLEGRSGIDPSDPSEDGLSPTMAELAGQGVNIIAPPLWVLLTVEGGKIVPSKYAKSAKAAGLDIITWTTERSGRIVEEVLEGGGSAFYYQSTLDAIENDGDIMVTLDVLAQQVGILGIFSDWPATVSYYASCMNLK